MPDNGALKEKTLLRFLICGSVDDGKSTLIGRLLHDTRGIFDDQLSALARASQRHGAVDGALDLALVTDGLEAEREQGITIDVAYRYFHTDRRSFIVADAPGHEQYTRNMAAGASTADMAVILIDASKGILPQTRRHSVICGLLGIRHVVVAVNKIDLVERPAERFQLICDEYEAFAATLGFASIVKIPLSAKLGHNVVTATEATAWFDGPTLLHCLESVDVRAAPVEAAFRMAVQWVNRAGDGFRGFAGTVASGRVAVGDKIVVASSGKVGHVARIATFDGDLDHAEAGQAVTVLLAEDIDISRGDMLAAPRARPDVADQFAAHVVWMGDEPLLPGRSYLLRCGTQLVPARVTALKYRVDITDLAPRPAKMLELNELGVCNLATDVPLVFDPYATSRATGGFILIDRVSHATVAAGMIDHALRRATNVHRVAHRIGQAERAAALGQTPRILWFTGLSGSGKSTIADLLEQELQRRGVRTMLLDGDNLRHGLNRDLGFSDADRVENIRRVGEVAALMVQAGLVVLCCFISPFAQERQMVRELVADGEFLEIFVDTPIEECIRRDPKGLYAKALAGQIPNFTGLGSAYEAPAAPDLYLDGMQAPDLAVRSVLLRLALADESA